MSDATFADLEDRARRLLFTPHAVEILILLRRGEHIPDALTNADQQAIGRAIDVLEELDLVDCGLASANQPAERTVTLTPRGESIADLF